MTTELASGDLVSDRYASALYDLASEKKIVDHVLTDLLLIKEIIDKHEELKLVIKSPLIVSNDKLKILQKITNSKKINDPYQWNPLSSSDL